MCKLGMHGRVMKSANFISAHVSQTVIDGYDDDFVHELAGFIEDFCCTEV